MKAISCKHNRSLSVGSYLTCADNTGAKIYQIISVRGYKGKRRTKPRTGIAGFVKCKVIKGNEKVRHELFTCVIIRATKEWRRASGMRVKFEDNAAIAIDEKLIPRGTLVKGPVAKETVERFPNIAKICSQVV